MRIVGFYSIPDISDKNYPALIHDHSLTVLKGNCITDYLHLERYSRQKYHGQMPLYMEELVRKLSLVDAKDTVFVFTDHEIGSSCLSKQGMIRFESDYASSLSPYPKPARLYWFGKYPEAYCINHEIAHLYSCIPFYGNFKENSLLVHFDGGASKSNFSVWLFKDGKVVFVDAHYRLKWLSSLFNANALVFALVKSKMKEQNSVPGKFMGLASYGRYSESVEQWLRENDFFAAIWSSKQSFIRKLNKKFDLSHKQIDNTISIFQDIAATIQEIFMRETIKELETLNSRYKCDYLYFSGGSALNIKLNRQILEAEIFNEVYIPPCPNDAGLSLGAAVAGAMARGIEVKPGSGYLNNFLIDRYSNNTFSEETIRRIADNLIRGDVIGICNGWGEAGPRALGNRSIIARADDIRLAKHVSINCKQREWYRPVAPVMLKKNVRYFTGSDFLPEIAKFMLTEFPILPAKKDELAGCTHIDNTSRIQVLSEKDENPFMFELLTCLDNLGVRALLNTSFNRQGEPIVHTCEQALKSARQMKLNGVVLNGEYLQID